MDDRRDIEPMGKVFICYSHEDQGFVDEFSSELGKQGIPYCRDTDHMPGHVATNTTEWRQAVQEALEQCTHMIVILSPHAVADPEMEAEWNTFSLRNRPIFPVLLCERQVPRGLGALEVWDLRHDRQGTMNKLLKSEA